MLSEIRIRSAATREIPTERFKILVLPATQAVVLTINTGGFAMLARSLGPEPFGIFATVLFTFTLASLVTDFAPHAYLLVNGIDRYRWLAARRVCIAGWACGAVLMNGLLAIQELTDWGGVGLTNMVILNIGLACQFAMQLPRAALTSARRYASLSAADISSAGLSVGVAVAMAAANVDPQMILAAQLTTGLVLRALLCSAMARTRPHEAGPSVPASGTRDALSFGLRAVPLNIGSYLSRSLDSGLVPFFIPAASAGVYARGYSLVVAPINQFQLALGPAILARLGAHARIGHQPRDRAFVLCWRAILGISVLGSILTSLLAGQISRLVFGGGWPDAELILTAMACSLPSLACSTFLAWMTQIFPRRGASLRHLACVLTGPVAAVLAAASGELIHALWALAVIGGVVQPLLLLRVHRPMLLGSYRAVRLQTVSAWLIPFSVFLLRLG
jgi:O-antigen/teichoic acid export membrane protein